MFVKNEILKRLQSGTCKVTFTKVNGESRTLNCTLNADVIPGSTTNESTKAQKDSNVINVWEVDLKQWRSFQFDRLTDIA